MHLLRADVSTLDETAPAVDLGQTRADVVVLSFADSDLSVLAKAWERVAPLAEGASLRLASLAALRHPYSVDLYVEKVVVHAHAVLVRLLGGLDYWRYGVEEISRAARSQGIALAFIPGDAFDDPRLDAASTLPAPTLARLSAYFRSGGEANAEAALRTLLSHAGHDDLTSAEPRPQGALGVLRCWPGVRARALVVFYRSAWLAGDTAPYEALGDALAARGFAVEALYVTSLKDPAVVADLRARLVAAPPDVIVNATAFSARLDEGGTAFDACDAPVLQAAVSLATREQWAASPRGLAPADLAMNVALPEVDGRLIAGAIAFKAPAARIASLEYAPQRAEPEAATVAHVADLAAAWAALRRTPNADKRLAFVLSDYPGKGGRAGYAVGLDTFASLEEMFGLLVAEGYDSGRPPGAQEIARRLMAFSADHYARSPTTGTPSPLAGEGWGGGAPANDAAAAIPARSPALSLARYREALANLPPAFVAGIFSRWGEPEKDTACHDGVFAFAYLRAGRSLVALQPDRGHVDTRADDYHDATLSPRHAYVAFYIWLREEERVHALVHVGAHGSLEWLPGKAAALSDSCAPRATLGAVPLIYPFIVNNPGEAAQAKRRTSAAILSHLTPPLVKAAPHGASAELEGLMDEYAEARALDPRRAREIADRVLTRASEAGLAQEAGLDGLDAAGALVALDAWLCDLKEMRIGDGLHVFGRAVVSEDALVAASPAAEMQALVDALAGRRVAPGPGGAPSRGRRDVLPTGRNLYSVDPRAVPTRAAWELGVKAGEAFLSAFVGDHGDWPRRVTFDLWGSSAMRTGGEDLAQALWLMGVRPRWDDSSNRVSGFEVRALAVLARPRVDVTLRISGLFRDVFPEQITLFQAAVAALAARDDEPDEENPLKGASARVFGAAPGRYGTGVARAALGGAWESRDDLGRAYLAASSHAYGGQDGDFAARVAASEAFVHVQDMAGQDVLDSDAFGEHEGGFAAAAASLGATPAMYHVDATRPEAPKARTLAREVARALRARATNPVWLNGQRRHGARGAAEIAETVDNLYLFAATTKFVADRHFDLLFDAVCDDAEMRGFLRDANPSAASAIADRFDDARRRGLWTTRRNSVDHALGMLRGRA
jgi:cobaltochelatase CobN